MIDSLNIIVSRTRVKFDHVNRTIARYNCIACLVSITLVNVKNMIIVGLEQTMWIQIKSDFLYYKAVMTIASMPFRISFRISLWFSQNYTLIVTSSCVNYIMIIIIVRWTNGNC